MIREGRGLNKKAEQHRAKLAQHCDVVLIHVFDPLESHLPAKGQYRFTDEQRDVVIDTGDKQRILSYQQRYQDRLDYLQQIANRTGLRFLQCSTADDPLEVLR